jgi:phenylacetate-CoA ligase
VTGAPGRLALLRLLLRGPDGSREALDRFRDLQLRRLVAHARDRVPHYRQRFERDGVNPEDVRSVADIARLSMVDRATMQALPPSEAVASGYDVQRLIMHRTSGSSGRPLEIRRTWAEERTYSLLRYRALRRVGLRVGDRRVMVVQVRRRHPRNRDWAQGLVRRAGLLRRTEVDALQPVEDIFTELVRLRPDVLTGYPGVLLRLASLLDQADRPRIRPRLLITGAEVLTPHARQRIALAFGAIVRETYASYEAPAIGWECAATGNFHVAEEGVILEVVTADGRPARPGEAGEVVVTPLHSFAMPFIRYRLGDIVTQGEPECPCGTWRATIRTIEGRMMDYFPLANGRTVHPLTLSSAAVDAGRAWLGQYQLTQERPDHLVFRVVPRVPPSLEDLSRLEAAILDGTGPGITLAVQLVPEIPLEASGKFRLSRSLVASHFDGIDWAARRRQESGR